MTALHFASAVHHKRVTRMMHYAAYGVPFTVILGSDAFLSLLTSVLPHGTTALPDPVAGSSRFSLLPPDEERRHGFRCFIGNDVSLESDTLEPVLEQLAQDLMVHVADCAPDLVFVHAGVVSWNNRAMVLPGSSFAGKTTLTAALLRLGATYYSDEYAVIDSAGAVHPYSRPLQIRRPGETKQQGTAAAIFGATSGEHALRVACVVFAEYEEAATWAPVQVSPGMAVLEMLRHTIPVQRAPARVMATLTKMLNGATAWAGVRGEVDEAAAQLIALLKEASPPQ